MERSYDTEILAFGAHPDDVDVAVGGIILQQTRQGKRVVIVDLTPSQLSTYGTPAQRQEEAQLAAERLGVDERVNLQLQDNQLSDNAAHICPLVDMIRKYKPRIVLSSALHDPHHPDHEMAGRLVKKAVFVAGLASHCDNQIYIQPHRPALYFTYNIREHHTPSCVIGYDQSIHDAKRHAIDAFASQRQSIDSELHHLHERLYGKMGGRPYGEGLTLMHGVLRIDNFDAIGTKPF